MAVNDLSKNNDFNGFEIINDLNNKHTFQTFPNHKKASVRAKERKIRQNKMLRKILMPKNALMALHEIKGVKISDFEIISKSGGGYVSQVTVNNIQYEGFGSSKTASKSNACEKALRDLFISKMFQKSLFKQSLVDKLDSIGNELTKNENKHIEMKSCESDDEDDVPMVSLASYALFKLFSEWETEGFEIPEFRSSSNSNNILTQTDFKKPSVRNELPQNWKNLHPAMLLCMMRPGTSYIDLGAEGNSPQVLQRVEITIDGENFVGVGRSKKIARKDAAINACNKLFGTNFIKEE